MRVSLGWVVLLMMACPGAATPAQPRPALQPGRRALGQARRQLRTAAVICCQQTALAWDRQAPAGDAGEDAGSRRRRTAREVLDIMAGARLQNKSRVRSLPLRWALWPSAAQHRASV